jgi:cyclophilin family peptidyl-prolyl cis-trans isomerase
MKLSVLCAVALSAAVTVASADEVLRVSFDVTSLDGKKGETGTFVMEAHSDWAPLGFARFKEMVETDFFKGIRFFRVIDGFMAQFGIHGKPAVAAEWKEKTLTDDPVIQSNKKSFVSFATSGKDSRTTQMFINFSDNANLDGMDFSPFAQVVEGMDVVDRIFKIGEKPDQGRIQVRPPSTSSKAHLLPLMSPRSCCPTESAHFRGSRPREISILRRISPDSLTSSQPRSCKARAAQACAA